MYLCYTDLFYSCVGVKGAKFDAIAFSIYFKSYPDVGYTRNARCPFWLASEGGIAARRSIFRVSIRDSRGVDGSICDRSWREKSPPGERVVEGKRIRNTWSMRPFSRSPAATTARKLPGCITFATNARWTDLRDRMLANVPVCDRACLSDHRDPAALDNSCRKTLDYKVWTNKRKFESCQRDDNTSYVCVCVFSTIRFSRNRIFSFDKFSSR